MGTEALSGFTVSAYEDTYVDSLLPNANYVAESKMVVDGAAAYSLISTPLATPPAANSVVVRVRPVRKTRGDS